ncbi:MAG TPA: hypothetical protein VL283_02450, partial [Candidatus Baltobacteraceae bacterium]|nr:hypothetical protein [Candidatus Baltobacteraceae bacterium]
PTELFSESAAKLRIAVLDGPFWAEGPGGPDLETIRANIDAARRVAIDLWNAGIACFTPQMNASYFESGCYRVPEPIYDFTIREILKRVGDCLFVLPGWERCPDVRERIDHACALGKPVFDSTHEILSWRDGGTRLVSLRMT